jgi:hypothetical protein
VAVQADSGEYAGVDLGVLNNFPRVVNGFQTHYLYFTSEIIKINSAESVWLSSRWWSNWRVFRS